MSGIVSYQRQAYGPEALHCRWKSATHRFFGNKVLYGAGSTAAAEREYMKAKFDNSQPPRPQTAPQVCPCQRNLILTLMQNVTARGSSSRAAPSCQDAAEPVRKLDRQQSAMVIYGVFGQESFESQSKIDLDAQHESF